MDASKFFFHTLASFQALPVKERDEFFYNFHDQIINSDWVQIQDQEDYLVVFNCGSDNNLPTEGDWVTNGYFINVDWLIVADQYQQE